MGKITKSRYLRNFKGVKLETKRHIEFATIIIKGKEEKFPILMSPGQIVNIKKAYCKYKKDNV